MFIGVCWMFENIIFGIIGCGGMVVEVVGVGGVGDFGVDGVGWGIVVGVGNGCLGVIFLGWFMLVEDYVFLLLVKSMIVWVCDYSI